MEDIINIQKNARTICASVFFIVRALSNLEKISLEDKPDLKD